MDTNGEYIGAPEYIEPTAADYTTGDEGSGDYYTAGGDYSTTGGDYYTAGGDYYTTGDDYISDLYTAGGDYLDDALSGFDFRRQLQDIGETGPDGYYSIDCYDGYNADGSWYNACYYGYGDYSGWFYTEEYYTGGDWNDWYYDTYGGYGDYYEWYSSTYYGYDYYGYGDYGDYDFFEPDFYSEEGDGLPRTAHIEWNLNYYENEEEETGRRGEETTMDGLDLSNLGIPLPEDFRLPEISEYYENMDWSYGDDASGDDYYYYGDDYYGYSSFGSNYEYGLFGGPDCNYYMDYDTYRYVYYGECEYYSFDDYFGYGGDYDYGYDYGFAGMDDLELFNDMFMNEGEEIMGYFRD